jgi:peptidoglycan/LPS O-acetylase OafA/YrhL
MALAAIALLAFHKEEVAMMTFGLTLLYLGFGFLLIRTVDASLPRSARFLTRPLAGMGYYSYSIYLWHVPVRVALVNWFPSLPDFLNLAIYLVVAVLWGIGASRLIEIPVLAYRDRYFPGAGQPASGPRRHPAKENCTSEGPKLAACDRLA